MGRSSVKTHFYEHSFLQAQQLRRKIFQVKDGRVCLKRLFTTSATEKNKLMKTAKFKIQKRDKKSKEPHMIVHICNPSTPRGGGRGRKTDFEASLSSTVRPYVNKQTNRRKQKKRKILSRQEK